MEIALAAITKPVASLEKELATTPPPAFFRRMTREFTGDETPQRMEVAVSVMRQRFPKLSVPDQLTWVLAHAAERGNIKMIDYLLEQGAFIDGSGRVEMPGVPEPARIVPVNFAIAAGKVEALAHLLKKGADPDAVGRQYLHNAAYVQSSPAMTSLLVKAGAKGGIDKTLAAVLLDRQRFDVADILIREGGANVNANGAKLAQAALKSGSPRTLEYLARNGADFAAAAQALQDTHKQAADLGRSWSRRSRVVRGRRLNFA